MSGHPLACRTIALSYPVIRLCYALARLSISESKSGRGDSQRLSQSRDGAHAGVGMAASLKVADRGLVDTGRIGEFGLGQAPATTRLSNR